MKRTHDKALHVTFAEIDCASSESTLRVHWIGTHRPSASRGRRLFRQAARPESCRMLHRDHASSRAWSASRATHWRERLLVSGHAPSQGNPWADGRLAIRAVDRSRHQVLRDLLAEVAKLHVAVSTLRSVHRPRDTELVRNEASQLAPHEFETTIPRAEHDRGCKAGCSGHSCRKGKSRERIRGSPPGVSRYLRGIFLDRLERNSALLFKPWPVPQVLPCGVP